MTKRILSIAAAATVALTTLGATAPAIGAPLAPAAQPANSAADSLIAEIKRGGKSRGHRGAGSKRHGRHFGYYKPYHGGGYYPAYEDNPEYCWTTKRVWTSYGWKWRNVFICY